MESTGDSRQDKADKMESCKPISNYQVELIAQSHRQDQKTQRDRLLRPSHCEQLYFGGGRFLKSAMAMIKDLFLFSFSALRKSSFLSCSFSDDMPSLNGQLIRCLEME